MIRIARVRFLLDKAISTPFQIYTFLIYDNVLCHSKFLCMFYLMDCYIYTFILVFHSMILFVFHYNGNTICCICSMSILVVSVLLSSSESVSTFVQMPITNVRIDKLLSLNMRFPTLWHFDKCRLRRAFAACFQA